MIPKVMFTPVSLQDNIDVVNLALNNKDSNFDFKNQTYKLFPELSTNNIEIVIKKHLLDSNKKINEAIVRYQKVWDTYNDNFMEELSKTLNINWPDKCKNIKGFIGVVPICPRDIENATFTLPYWLDNETVLDAVAHECCHFLYFEKWKQLFPDFDENSFNTPHLIWKLSEMVIDFILNKENIQQYLRHNFKSYYYFYEKNKEEMGTIKELYEKNSIEDAIRLSYSYLLEREATLDLKKLIDEYKNQDLINPKYFFHGSPKLLDIVKKNNSHDSNGNEVNIDNAVFATPSFLIATAYAFKDTIKDNSIKSGLHYNFNISQSEKIPIMTMENVDLVDDIKGYIYVFANDGTFKNEPSGSLQFKQFEDAKPIGVLKIKYSDYKDNYEIIEPITRKM
ncbi:MAG: hypothetical protein RR359_03885 [Bacilli bacterium]